MTDERIRIEIGFDGGQIAGLSLSTADADRLQQALQAGGDGVLDLEAEDGRVAIVVAKVAYVRRAARDSRVGFGGR
ncbi:MAG: hypothetical protein R3C15_12220 [Thermoleophilia bacterium]